MVDGATAIMVRPVFCQPGLSPLLSIIAVIRRCYRSTKLYSSFFAEQRLASLPIPSLERHGSTSLWLLFTSIAYSTLFLNLSAGLHRHGCGTVYSLFQSFLCT